MFIGDIIEEYLQRKGYLLTRKGDCIYGRKLREGSICHLSSIDILPIGPYESKEIRENHIVKRMTFGVIGIGQIIMVGNGVWVAYATGPSIELPEHCRRCLGVPQEEFHLLDYEAVIQHMVSELSKGKKQRR